MHTTAPIKRKSLSIDIPVHFYKGEEFTHIRHSRVTSPGLFFPSLFSQSSTIHEPVPTVASNTVTVPREEPDVIFYCCRPSTLNFTMLYILRCFSPQHGCNEWFSLPLLLSLNQPDHFPRTAHTNKALFSAELPLTACFLFFKAFFVNSRDPHA